MGKWLAEIVKIGLVFRYKVADRPYIWLRFFLRHQVVNKPTESELPPHPDDEWADIPIREAYKLAKAQESSDTTTVGEEENSGSSTGDLPLYARTRAVPFLSCSSTSSKGEEKLDARARTHAVGELFAYWQEQCGHPTSKLSPDRRGKIDARLREGRTPEEVRRAIDGAARAPHVSDAGKRFDDIGLVCRNGEKFESFLERGRAVPPHQLVGVDGMRGAREEEEEMERRAAAENHTNQGADAE